MAIVETIEWPSRRSNEKKQEPQTAHGQGKEGRRGGEEEEAKGERGEEERGEGGRGREKGGPPGGRAGEEARRKGARAKGRSRKGQGGSGRKEAVAESVVVEELRRGEQEW